MLFPPCKSKIHHITREIKLNKKIYNCMKYNTIMIKKGIKLKWRELKKPASHAGNTGSSPVGITNNKIKGLASYGRPSSVSVFVNSNPISNPKPQFGDSLALAACYESLRIVF